MSIIYLCCHNVDRNRRIKQYLFLIQKHNKFTTFKHKNIPQEYNTLCFRENINNLFLFTDYLLKNKINFLKKIFKNVSKTDKVF